MQVSLDAVDWEQLTRFGTAEAFLGQQDEQETDEELHTLSCYDHGWVSDSAIQYFEVAAALEHLATISRRRLAAHLRQGIQRLITEQGHIDEFAMAKASEGHYWISVSPATVETLKNHIDALNLKKCVRLLAKRPPADVEDVMADLDGLFVSFIKQHARMVDLAVAKGYGLLGHCG